jgi:hypothetical protein
MKAEDIKKSYVNAFYEQYKADFNNANDEIKVAVDLAYRDAQRTMVKIDDTRRDDAKNAVSNAIKGYLGLEEEDIPSTKESFDDEHKKMCSAWCKEFEKNGELTEHGNYGKAQKIVNMALKYLYCYYSVKKWDKSNSDRFKFCHFTLDSFTLRWLNGCGVKGKPSFLDSNLTWSSSFIPQKNDKGNYLCQKYDAIQEYARKSVGEVFQRENWTALEAEFYVWDNVQYYDCLKNLVKHRKTHFDADIFSEDLFNKIENNYESLKSKRGLNNFIEERKKKLLGFHSI